MVVYQKVDNYYNDAMGPLGFLWAVLIVLRVMEIITWHWGVVIFWPVALVVVGLLCLAGFACLGYLWWEYHLGLGKKH